MAQGAANFTTNLGAWAQGLHFVHARGERLFGCDSPANGPPVMGDHRVATTSTKPPTRDAYEGQRCSDAMDKKVALTLTWRKGTLGANARLVRG
jgi:hypothetical protein